MRFDYLAFIMMACLVVLGLGAAKYYGAFNYPTSDIDISFGEGSFNVTEYYNITQIETILQGYYNISSVYNITEISNQFLAYYNITEIHIELESYYNTTDIISILNGYSLTNHTHLYDYSDFANHTDIPTYDFSDFANHTDIPTYDFSGFVNQSTIVFPDTSDYANHSDLTHTHIHGTNRALGVIGWCSGTWTTTISSLTNAFDGDFETVTPYGTREAASGGREWYIDFDLGAKYAVLVSAKMGVYINVSAAITQAWLYSNDNSTWTQATGTTDGTITATSEMISHTNVDLINARYIRLKFWSSFAATSIASIRIYEFIALDVGFD
jgi:hypothetical protein